MGRRRDAYRRRAVFAHRFWYERAYWANGFGARYYCPRCGFKELKISLRKIAVDRRRATFHCSKCGFGVSLVVPVWYEYIDAYNALMDRVYSGEIGI